MKLCLHSLLEINLNKNRMRRGIAFVLLLIISGISVVVLAQDRHFSWTYESVTIPKGAIDMEPWVTVSGGKDNYYIKYETRIEFETGLTDKLQTALYMNANHVTQAITDSTDNIIGLEKSSGYSFSNEWKFNLMNPSTAPVGLGLYAEYGISPDEVELELKLLLDKKTPNSIFAYNFVNEFEFEYEFEKEESGEGEIEIEREYIIENDLAYMYLFKPSFGLGLEARNKNEFVKGELEHSVIYLGPTLFYAQNNFFAIINVMPQLTNLNTGGIDLDEHEKLVARILIGISL